MLKVGIEKIEKRDGRIEDFNLQKIENAILKAGEATGEFNRDIARKLALRVATVLTQYNWEHIPNVEDIQDIVEEILLLSPYKKTAKAYVLYRDQHRKIREIASKINLELVDSYLSKEDWQVNENSNMSFSLQGLNNYLSSEISKVYWLNKIYPPEIRDSHINADFHIHDLGSISVYCVGWDLQDLLISGFKGVSGKVESKPAKHFRTVLGQIVNFFYTLQGEASGAQAFSNFDTFLAPFVYYDGLKYSEIKQALQEFVFNLNVPTRVGFQTPFTNLTFDLTVPDFLKNENVIVGGELKDKKYGDFQNEMDLINRAFLEIMAEGDAKGRVFTFPIPTYNIGYDFEWDSEKYLPLWKVTGKYGIPYFANFVNSDMKPEDARSMCCRLRIDNRALKRKGGGLFGASPLTGSIGVVTINLPRIGFLAKDERDFFTRLDNLLEKAKQSLEIKRKVLEKFTENNLYPYMKFYLRNMKKRFGSYWKNHFSTIGIIGMNEACYNLFGFGIETEKGLLFAENVLTYIRERLIKFQEQTNNYYNLEATPAESASYRLAKIDKKLFPYIITAADLDNKLSSKREPFYTNSSYLPVDYTDDLFFVIQHQNRLQPKYTGGTVLHIYLGESSSNPESIKNLIKKVCQNTEIPYFSITPTFSVCENCGFISGEHFLCPKCGKECEIYSRIVGYLRPVSQWNKGKKEEFNLRKVYRLENQYENRRA